MFDKDALNEIEQWRRQAIPPQHQLDWRWISRYRELDAFDSYWWLASAGPFNEEEQRQWDQLFMPDPDEVTKEQLGKVIARSRQRELAAAIAAQREPHLHFPALDITEVRRRIAAMLQLDGEIRQNEPNAIVRRFYHGAIEEEMNYLRLIEATYEGNTEHFWMYTLHLVPFPTSEEMAYALSRVRRVLLQGFMRQETIEISQHVVQFMSERLNLSLDLSFDEAEAQELQNEPLLSSSQPRKIVTPQAAKRFFEMALRDSGYDGWQVVIDPNAVSPRVEQGLRCLFVPDARLPVARIRDYLSHELAGHAARCVAGERSLLGLLGVNTKNSLETEEGFALYYEPQMAALDGRAYDESGTWLGTLATGLATGVSTPPQTFSQLFAFFELFLLLYRLVRRRDEDMQTAREQARKRSLERCLRTYRGVPDLEKAGVCFTKDALYLRGLGKVQQAVAQDETVLDRLAVGVVALEHLPELQELGIVVPSRPLMKLASDPELDSYILSFETSK